jgi:hypothetical protein
MVSEIVGRDAELASLHAFVEESEGGSAALVLEGEAGIGKCAPHVVSAGHGFVDDARGHIVRNESGLPAQDVSVIIAPVGAAFRGELSAPGPYCGF